MDTAKIFEQVLSQCGVLSGILFAALVYQTWQRGRDRDLCERALGEARERVDRMMQWLMVRSAE